MLMYPMVLDAGQTAGDVLELLKEMPDLQRRSAVLVRWTDRLRVRWFGFDREIFARECAVADPTRTIADACTLATRDRESAECKDIAEMPSWTHKAHGWIAYFSGTRVVGLQPPALMSAPPPDDAHGAATSAASGELIVLPFPYLDPAPAPAAAATRGESHHQTRGQHAKPPDTAPAASAPAGAPPVPTAPASEQSASAGADDPVASETGTDTLLAMPHLELPDRCQPGIDTGVTLSIGLSAPATPTDAGVMAFVSARTVKTLDIEVMVEAPDFTCVDGWKHTLTVTKADPFSKLVELHLIPLAAENMTVRQSIVRVHYSYNGQPAGTAMRRILLGDATLEDAEATKQPAATMLQIAPTSAPVDLTIRISRRDESDAARELIWTLLDCAHPIALPNAPITQKVGDRDTASSFATKVTSQVNAADGTVAIDTMMRGIGTLVRRAIPAEVLKALADVAAAVGSDRLARILLLTDESYVPWELALLDPPPSATRAPYLGAQFAVSRWLHGEVDVVVPPPATLNVKNLAVVLGNYDASSLNALPHAKEESAALVDQAAKTPALFPHVTSVTASLDSVVDLLNGKLPSATGMLAPEMVHFACHGEVLGSGISKRSVLYLNDGTAMPETLFVAAALGRETKSFLFMNACQVGVGGDELGQYAGFPGMAIGAGFSGFIGPLWSVNDQIAKGIALDFYTRAFGADGSAPRPVADVLADMRSQYASEPDPKLRQSTWLAYVHYGHPHFTLSHT